LTSATTPCFHRVPGHRAQASAVGLLIPLLFSPGGCGGTRCCDPLLEIAQIPGAALDLDQLICDGKTLRGSIEPTVCGCSAFIAQVTLCSAAFGVAISQPCFATGDSHERALLRQLLGEQEFESVLIQAQALHTQRPFSASPGAWGRLPLDSESQPENPALPDLHPVLWEAHNLFCGRGSVDQPRS